jgi:hypothetical protein
MSAPAALRLFALAVAVTLTVAACKKDEAAVPPGAPAAAPAPVAAPAPAVPAPAAVSPTAAAEPAKAAGLSVLTDPCPLPGEDAATCPSKQAKVDDDLKVGHVLIGWNGSLPDKAVERTKEQALELARKVAHEARMPGADFVKLIRTYSQDPGGGIYGLPPSLRTRFVPQFTAMAVSLGMGQVDVVETNFGYHVMKRLPFDFEPPLDPVLTDACPLPGEDPTTCPKKVDPKPDHTLVMHILIGYAGSLPGTQVTRTKDEAKVLAIQIAHQARKKGADFAALMKANSQDTGPGTYPVTPDAGLVPPFKHLGLSLGVGQIDIVETDFGYHVMKRTE